MKIKIDEVGRIIIPKNMREHLGIINISNVNIELDGNKIIITNPEGIKTKKEIENRLMDVSIYENVQELTYKDGYINALKWVLKGEDNASNNKK